MHQGKDKEAKEDAAEAEPPTEAAPAPVALVPKLSPTEVLRQAAAKRADAFFKVPPFTLLRESARLQCGDQYVARLEIA